MGPGAPIVQEMPSMKAASPASRGRTAERARLGDESIDRPNDLHNAENSPDRREVVARSARRRTERLWVRTSATRPGPSVSSPSCCSISRASKTRMRPAPGNMQHSMDVSGTAVDRVARLSWRRDRDADRRSNAAPISQTSLRKLAVENSAICAAQKLKGPRRAGTLRRSPGYIFRQGMAVAGEVGAPRSRA